MPTKEGATAIKVMNALEPQVIGSNTTTTGAIIDTADFDLGLCFAVLVTARTDGTFTLKIEDGDDAALADAADVATAQLVYGALPAISAGASEGDIMAKEAVHSTKRYVRPSIVSTGVTTGATVQVVAIKWAELLPTPQAS